MINNYDNSKGKIATDIGKGVRPSLLKINKTKININSLINKKFKFNSAFDEKGAKNFLKSKKIALQQIILDDGDENNESSETERKKAKNNSLKKWRRNTRKRVLTNDSKKNKIHSCTNVCLYNQNNKSNNNNDNIKSSKDIHYSSNKELINKKKIRRFLSSHELKMFENKEIKKIKAIKKVSKTKFNNEKNNEDISFLEKNDTSIIDILSEML